MNPYFELHKRTAEQIIEENYYDSAFVDLIYDNGFTDVHSFYECTDAAIIDEIYSKFWWSLPDHRIIRRDPFFAICDIIEMGRSEDESDQD